ncbi:MAG: MFS transporter [Paracoccaceae bacterium]
MTAPTSLRADARWLGAGTLMALSSSFGQTYFIAIYAGFWRESFGLSHGDWGAIYMAATLAAAAALTQAGRLADMLPARRLACFVLLVFAAIAVGVAFAWSWAMLTVLIFGLRLCGQGMMSHIALTSMAKWFRAKRARAIAFAALGFSIGGAAMPASALALTALVGWRSSWLIIAAVILLVIIPLLRWLLRSERQPSGSGGGDLSTGLQGRHWTRAEVARHWVFWALIPGLVGPSWVSTVIFFQTVHVAQIKDWDIIAYTGLAFPVYSATTICASFSFGWLADRFGAVRLLPVYLLGWMVGAALLSFAGGLPAGVAALAVCGLGSGGVSVVTGAIFAELYGARWIGGVRSIVAAITVLASALGPGFSGALLDAGVGFERQCLFMGGYLAAVSCWFAYVSVRARRLLAEKPVVSA